MTWLKILLSFLRGKSPSLVLVELVKAVAEGHFGEKPKAVYWGLAGIKTWITLGVGAFWTVLWQFSDAGVCGACDAWANGIGLLALFLASVGLWDASIRATPPKR